MQSAIWAVGVMLATLTTVPAARAQTQLAWAQPPPGRAVPDEPGPYGRPVVQEPHDEPSPSLWSTWDRERSPVRLSLGPQTSVTDQGAHFGALAALDLGRGRLGGRLSASWARGLDTSAGSPSLAQFSSELTLDFAKRGLLHPVMGLGLSVLYIEHGDVKAFAGAGTLRAGLEVPLPVQEADLRVGLSAQGGLVGPRDERLERMRGLGNVLATFSLGF